MNLKHNPLLVDTDLPAFSRIKPEHVRPAIEYILQQCRDTVEATAQITEHSWDTLITPLEQADDKLSKAWSPVSHMNAVISTEELREAHDSCLPLLSDYGTFVGQHEGLYRAYKNYADSAEFQTLTAAQQRVITEAIKDFRLSGVALDKEKKQRYGTIQSRLSDLSSLFSNNLLDATHAWFCHITDQQRLAGLPESAQVAAAAEAQERKLEGWVFTLDIPSYLPVMMYADDRALREEMYRAFVTRASELGPNAGEYDNTAAIEETMALRQELAELLGFANYAELSLESKMAESPAQVVGFLEDLAKRSLPQAQQELAEVKAFAAALGEQGISKDDIAAWDLAYYSEQLKQQSYEVSDELLRPYFPEHHVVSGLFTVTGKLFGVSFAERSDVDTWHEQVRYFDVLDADKQVVAGFYLDLFARAKKRGGAWMADHAVRRRTPLGIQKPIAYLTCNFNRPQGDTPALFTHDEVVTLFHEFGHGLHHMLTKVDIAAISGINGVPWDAVELPSQFLENWCWEKEALAFISKHYQSGETLPEDLLQKMLAAKNFQSAMQMVRQLEFSLFDMAIHMNPAASEPGAVQAILNSVRERSAVVKPPEFNRFQHSFGHIFAGGYAAGYYSYKWAEVLSADAFARFEEEGIFNANTGRDFQQAILEAGGSDEIMNLFRKFRGREPDISALLRHSGIGIRA
ncbi:oligopeptidase A [Aliidiomarina quisquiliarum]|uniref:oligopeptidase A n=1 Tax=Aliidiomarina quisquiliarum TaxID=2938947 RepID=UPI00208F8398|nr:oligopeptidase A [Aliidiomarina quisquiliarum]MCO4321135.1 oligopeptidase A [Aliidiomarina quisquiliarum]